MKFRPRGAGVLAALALAEAVLLVGSAATPAAGDATPILTPELRSDVTALLAGRHALDPRLERLVAGHRSGEIAYFVVLDTPRTGAHRTALERPGARILREYQTIDAFAVASVPRVLKRVAMLPGVTRLVPGR